MHIHVWNDVGLLARSVWPASPPGETGAENAEETVAPAEPEPVAEARWVRVPKHRRYLSSLGLRELNKCLHVCVDGQVDR